jgi:septum formation protein
MTESTIWRDSRPLVLASKSQIRLSLLQQAGLAPLAYPPEFDERAFETLHHLERLPPVERSLRLSGEKARLVSDIFPGHWVVGADQLLVCDETILHKAANRNEALSHLCRLAGKTHHLISGCAVARDGIVRFEAYDEARLTMRPLSDVEISHYLDHAGDAVLANVGCYALEGLGVHLFDAVEGNFFTILGLPLQKMLCFFREEGNVSL